MSWLWLDSLPIINKVPSVQDLESPFVSNTHRESRYQTTCSDTEYLTLWPAECCSSPDLCRNSSVWPFQAIYSSFDPNAILGQRMVLS